MMAEDRIDILMSPKIIEIEIDNIRRNSSGKIGVPNNGAKILSRYLRASTGSCHDLCKYGHKHAVEAEVKSHMQKRITATQGSEGQYLEKTQTLSKKKKKSVIGLKPSPNSKTWIPDTPLVNKREVSSSAKRVGVSKKGIYTICASDSNLKPPKPSSLPTPGRSSIKRNFYRRKNPLGGSNSRRHFEIGINKVMRTSKIDKKEGMGSPSVSMYPTPSVKRVASKNAGNYKNVKRMSHLKSRNNARKAAPKQGSNEKAPEKILYIVEPEAENKTVGPTKNVTRTIQLSPSSEDKDLRHAQNGSHTIQLSPSFEDKGLRHGPNVLRRTQSLPSYENKSLRCIGNGIRRTLSYSSPLSSLSSSMAQSESTPSGENGMISEHYETETEKQSGNRKMEYNSKPRRSGITSSEDKDCQPRKLNFRRGKVVDLQTEINTPRRLRFRRGRVLGENQNREDDTKARDCRRREVADGELNGNNTDSVKVLKHNDAEGKKDAQGLINNVIEETASKLAGSRKSKVKALVGAFETVISLRETNPSVITSTY